MRFRAPWRRSALTCQELVELVTDYFEGALSGSERKRFEAHVADCPNCTIYIEHLRDVHAQFGRLAPADLSAESELELRRAFIAWRAG